jgi:hypothetical protein
MQTSWNSLARGLDTARLLAAVALLAPVCYLLAWLPQLARVVAWPPALPLLVVVAALLALGGSVPLGRWRTCARIWTFVLVAAAVALGTLWAFVVVRLALAALAAPAPARLPVVSGPVVVLGGLPYDLGAAIVAGWVVCLLIIVPWLALAWRQPWWASLAVALSLAAGWDALPGGGKGVEAVAVGADLLAASLALVLATRWRARVDHWRQLRLGGAGRVGRRLFAPLPAQLVAAAALATLLALANAAMLAPLSSAWRSLVDRQPATTRLVLREAQGQRVIALDDRLDTGSPAPVLSAADARRPVLSYSVLAVPAATPALPPLMVGAFDTFDGRAWTATGHTVLRRGALADADGSMRLRARVRAEALVRGFGDGYAPLPAFDQATHVSSRAGDVWLEVGRGTSGSPSLLDVTGWRLAGQLAPGATYDVDATLAGDQATSSPGALDPGLRDRLVQLPPDLASPLGAEASGWIAAAAGKDDLSRARALLAALDKAYTYDPLAEVPRGAAPLQWFLAGKRGDALAFASAYAAFARSLGLPVRVVEGYLPGVFDGGEYVVRPLDAAVWVQLADPARGWLDLFPIAPPQLLTVPRPAPLPAGGQGKGTKNGAAAIVTATPNDASDGEAPTKPTPVRPPATSPLTPQDLRGALQRAGVGLLLLLLLVLLILLLARSLRLGRLLGRLPPGMRDLALVAILARRAGYDVSFTRTPLENVESLATSARLSPVQTAALRELNRRFMRWRFGFGDAAPTRVRGALQFLIAPLVARLWTRPLRPFRKGSRTR